MSEAARRSYWPIPAEDTITDRKLAQSYRTRTYQVDAQEQDELDRLDRTDPDVAIFNRDQIPGRLTQRPRDHVGNYKVNGQWEQDGATLTYQEISHELITYLTFREAHIITEPIAKLMLADQDWDAWVVYQLVTPNFPYGRGFPLRHAARVLGLELWQAKSRLARGRTFIRRVVTDPAA